MTAVGIWLFPDAPAADLASAIQAAESLGVDEVWLGDEGAQNRDPFAVLAAAAIQTRTVTLGVAVTNPYLRHPAVTASAMMTVQELSGGRGILGVGAGGGISLAPLGVPRDRPLKRVREFIHLARAVASGTSTEGYEPPDGAFRVPSLPIYVGSRSEGLNRLASSIADGVFIGPTPSFLLDRTLSWAMSVHRLPVALYLNAVFDIDELEWLRPRLAHSLLDSPEITRRNFGLEDTELADAIEALGHDDDEPARKLVTDEIMAHFVLSGSAEDIAHRVAQVARTHQPASIGLCLRTSGRAETIGHSIAALAIAKKELE
jgi:5,10-methylenetetrahydromethanopterin reductase